MLTITKNHKKLCKTPKLKDILNDYPDKKEYSKTFYKYSNQSYRIDKEFNIQANTPDFSKNKINSINSANIPVIKVKPTQSPNMTLDYINTNDVHIKNMEFTHNFTPNKRKTQNFFEIRKNNTIKQVNMDSGKISSLREYEISVKTAKLSKQSQSTTIQQELTHSNKGSNASIPKSVHSGGVSGGISNYMSEGIMSYSNYSANTAGSAETLSSKGKLKNKVVFRKRDRDKEADKLVPISVKVTREHRERSRERSKERSKEHSNEREWNYRDESKPIREERESESVTSDLLNFENEHITSKLATSKNSTAPKIKENKSKQPNKNPFKDILTPLNITQFNFAARYDKYMDPANFEGRASPLLTKRMEYEVRIDEPTKVQQYQIIPFDKIQSYSYQEFIQSLVDNLCVFRANHLLEKARKNVKIPKHESIYLMCFNYAIMIYNKLGITDHELFKYEMENGTYEKLITQNKWVLSNNNRSSYLQSINDKLDQVVESRRLNLKRVEEKLKGIKDTVQRYSGNISHKEDRGNRVKHSYEEKLRNIQEKIDQMHFNIEEMTKEHSIEFKEHKKRRHSRHDKDKDYNKSLLYNKNHLDKKISKVKF